MSKKVALMVGHGKTTSGSWDCGCTYAGNTEAALMLPITKAAVKYLRQSGITVISDADTNNNKNMVVDVEWANREKADIYVSVHCDWYKAPTGVYPLYVSDNGKKLADALNTAVKAGMGMKSRGLCKRTDLWELNGTNMTACILETGSIKADISKLKSADKYGKCIAKGICAYLGVKFKELSEPVVPVAQAPTAITYRVRKTWADAKSQVGAYKVLANAKKVADEKGLNVYDDKGTLVYQGNKATATQTIYDKELDACKVQAEWMKNYTYKWQSNPTVEKSKRYGTCVTYVACVLQRIGVLKSGESIWHTKSGKVDFSNSKIVSSYPKGTLKSLKGQLKRGDIVMAGDKKSTEAGGNSHIFILTGEWDSKGNPYIWDNHSAERIKKGQGGKHTYSGANNVIAVVRIKTDTTESKIASACKAQTEWSYKSKYDWQSSPTVEKSKTVGTCVTYVACVFQRLKVFPSGTYIWHNGSGYGNGKAYGQTDKFKITYYNNKKTLANIKATLKEGDVVMYDDNKSGKSGAGGHIEIYTGSGYKFYTGGMGTGHNTKNDRIEKSARKVLCVCRVKDGLIE